MDNYFRKLRSETTMIKSKLYFVTIVCQQKKKKLTCCELSEVIKEKLQGNIGSLEIIELGMEEDPLYRQLHAHMLVNMDKRVTWSQYTYYKDPVSDKSYRIYWKPVDPWSVQQVIRYIKKGDNKSMSPYAEQQKDIEYFSNHYGFSDSETSDCAQSNQC